MHHDPAYKISQLRVKNQTAMLTAIAAMLAALFASIMLPSLLVTYVYDTTQMFEAPLLLELISPVSFILGFGYFLVALVGNIMRSKRMAHLEKECDLGGGCGSCCGSCCQSDDDMMMELDSLAEVLIKEKPAKKATKSTKTKSAKKSTAKKSTKKSTKKTK